MSDPQTTPLEPKALIKVLIDVATEFDRVCDDVGKSTMSSPFYDVAMMIVEKANNYVEQN
jgi:hypothetical protein